MILIKISVKRWGNKTQTIILKNNKSKLQSGNSEIFYVLSYLDVRGHCMEAPGLGLPVTLAGLTGTPPPPSSGTPGSSPLNYLQTDRALFLRGSAWTFMTVLYFRTKTGLQRLYFPQPFLLYFSHYGVYVDNCREALCQV